MTQSKSVRFRHAAFAAAAILLSSGAIAHAQLPKDADDVEPWRAPQHDAYPAHATSSLDATKSTVATPAQQRETRTLAIALFAKPAAAQRAADKAAEAYQQPIAPASPKPEWLVEDGIHPGGRGLEVSTPF